MSLAEHHLPEGAYKKPVLKMNSKNIISEGANKLGDNGNLNGCFEGLNLKSTHS
jgi:hypothetical protein